jgi:HSP20 family molecular chaperone IbpA
MTSYKMSLQQLVSNGIALMEGNQSSNVSGALSEFLQSQGVNLNEIWQPAVDIVENANVVCVYINIPGVKNDTIDVDFFNNRIVITGERKRPFTERMSVVKNEIIYGKFERQIIIPISVTNQENVKITSKSGVLVITIDKAGEERNRFSLRVPQATRVSDQE